ncbi:MAG: DUF3592 domain-containing protein [Anaerolineae bacterium]|nr:DUF3592 domain-containing protein [Anaerolineae bacterium]
MKRVISGCFITLFLLAFLGMPLAIGVIAGGELWEMYRLNLEGTTTEGSIQGKRITESTDGEGNTAYTFLLRYSFRVERLERRFEAEQAVGKGFYDDHAVNQGVQVRYLPGDPATSEIAGARGVGTIIENVLLLLICTAAPLLIVLGFALSALAKWVRGQRWRRQADLAVSS